MSPAALQLKDLLVTEHAAHAAGDCDVRFAELDLLSGSGM